MRIRNLQNIDRDPRIRKLFAAKEGYLLVEGDLSQAESRLDAYYAEETQLIKLYEEGRNVHEFVGSIIFQKPVSKKADPALYNISKTIVHGSDKGMGFYKISEDVLNRTGEIIAPIECKRRQAIYFQNFPNIKSVLHKGITQELDSKNQTLTSVYGFKRRFYTPSRDERTREAVAHYAQNLVAYITYKALLAIDESWLEPYYIHQIHDSILLEVPKDKVDLAVQDLKKFMTQPLTIKGRACIIPTEVKVGKNLGEMKEFTCATS